MTESPHRGAGRRGIDRLGPRLARDQLRRAPDEAGEPAPPSLRPYLRSAVLESVRWWPTTPTLLPDTTADTQWRNGTIEKGAALMIVTPACHRDDELLPFARRFAPDIPLDGRAQQYPQLVAFAAGPAECPGRNPVLFIASTLLAYMLSASRVELTSTPRPTPDAGLRGATGRGCCTSRR